LESEQSTDFSEFEQELESEQSVDFSEFEEDLESAQESQDSDQLPEELDEDVVVEPTDPIFEEPVEEKPLEEPTSPQQAQEEPAVEDSPEPEEEPGFQVQEPTAQPSDFQDLSEGPDLEYEARLHSIYQNFYQDPIPAQQLRFIKFSGGIPFGRSVKLFLAMVIIGPNCGLSMPLSQIPI